MSITRVKEKYMSVREGIKTELGFKNLLMVPKIEKVVLNMGLGRISEDDKAIKRATDDLTSIAGQKAVPTTARIAVAGFKVRQGQVVGARVTLRGEKMYEFIDRLISIALPRTKDFRGIPNKAFAGGSYSLGIKEHTVFPEIAISGVDPMPLQATIVFNTKSPVSAKAVLVGLGFPFKKENK